MPGELRRRRLLEEERGGWEKEEAEAGAQVLHAEAEAGAQVLHAEAEVAEEEAEGTAAVEQGGGEKAAEKEGRPGVTRVALTSAGLTYAERIALGVDPDLALQQLPVSLTTHRMQFFPADYFNSSQLKLVPCRTRPRRSRTLTPSRLPPNHQALPV